MTLVLWLVPLALVVAGALPLFLALVGVADEAAALRGEIRRARQLRPALVETGRGIRALHAPSRPRPR